MSKRRSVEELMETSDDLLYEDFQRIYFYLGLSALIKRLERQFNDLSKERLNLMVKAVLYGYRADGTPRDKPCLPDPFLMVENSFLYDFQGKVWKNYVKMENR